MIEKKSKLEQILPYQNKILWDVVVLAILSIVTFFLPVATYTYRQSLYSIKGIRFLSGVSIMQGKVTITPNMWAILVVVIAGLVLITAIAFLKMKAKYAGTILLILGVAQFVVSIIFSKNFVDILETAKGKNVALSSGNILLVFVSLLVIVRAFHILYKNKAVVPLDFMALPGVLYFLINNYFPMFGIFIAFKKVDYTLGIFNSPWVGFENFKYLFTTQDAFIMTRNTILYNLVFIIVGNVVGILIGIMLYEIVSRTWQKLFQTTILLPQLISMIIVPNR